METHTKVLLHPKPGVSNIRSKDQDWPDKDSNEAHWMVFGNALEGIHFGFLTVFNMAFSFYY